MLAVLGFPWPLSWVGCFCVHAWGGQFKEERAFLPHSLGVGVTVGKPQWQELKAAGYIVSSEESAEFLLNLLSPFIQDKPPSLGNGTANYQSGSAYTSQCNEDNSPQACPQICLLDDSQLSWLLTQTITKGHLFPFCNVAKTQADASLNSQHCHLLNSFLRIVQLSLKPNNMQKSHNVLAKFKILCWAIQCC